MQCKLNQANLWWSKQWQWDVYAFGVGCVCIWRWHYNRRFESFSVACGRAAHLGSTAVFSTCVLRLWPSCSALKHFCVSLFFVHGCLISWFFFGGVGFQIMITNSPMLSSGNFFRSESDSEIGKEKARCIWMRHETIWAIFLFHPLPGTSSEPFPDNEGFNVCWTSLASCDLFMFWAQKATVMKKATVMQKSRAMKTEASDQCS